MSDVRTTMLSNWTSRLTRIDQQLNAMFAFAHQQLLDAFAKHSTACHELRDLNDRLMQDKEEEKTNDDEQEEDDELSDTETLILDDDQDQLFTAIEMYTHVEPQPPRPAAPIPPAPLATVTSLTPPNQVSFRRKEHKKRVLEFQQAKEQYDTWSVRTTVKRRRIDVLQSQTASINQQITRVHRQIADRWTKQRMRQLARQWRHHRHRQCHQQQWPVHQNDTETVVFEDEDEPTVIARGR